MSETGFYPTEIATLEPTINTTQKLNYANFRKYVDNLDVHIKTSCLTQAKVLNRSEFDLKKQVNAVKLKIDSMKGEALVIQNQFKKQCQNLLKEDILKWSNYQDFYSKMFRMYSKKIAYQQQMNDLHKKRIKELQAELKQHLKQQRLKKSISFNLLQKMPLQKPNDNSTLNSINTTQRLKTQSSLPALKIAPSRLKNTQRLKTTLQSQCSQTDVIQKVSYMQPIGYRKKKEQSSLGFLMELLEWQKNSKQQHNQDNWFQKIIFNKRHYEKLMKYLKDHNNDRKVKLFKI